MITVICGLLIFMGLALLNYQLIVPVTISDWQSGIVTSYNISGLMLTMIGLFVLMIRQRQTGAGSILNLPRENEIKLFYQAGYSPNTQIRDGKLIEDNLIKSGSLLINYKGGGFRIAGHECIRVHGNIACNVPEWFAAWHMKIRDKYQTSNLRTLRRIYDFLQSLDPDSDLTLEEQLKSSNIPELARLADDEKRVKELAEMDVNDLKDMAETIWDGTTWRMYPDIDDLIQTATPASIYQYAQREYFKKVRRDKMFKPKNESVDLAKYAIPIAIIAFVLLLVLSMFGGR